MPINKVAEIVKQEKPQILGLSALMTTTVKNMEKTIACVRQFDSDIKVFVGGAVLNESIAKQIGADYYSKDPRQMVKILQSLNL